MLANLDAAWRAGLAPEPQTTVSEWADMHRLLPPTAAEPGRWRTSRTPYLKEIMDVLSVASPFERVVFMKGAQIGATEAGLNWLGYTIHNAPGLMLYVMPSIDSVRRNVRTRIDPMIDATPALRERVTKAKTRTPGNSQSLKTFPGGQVAFTGANSAVGLRSTPARYLFLDEIDGFPADADGEGDPVALAIQRAVTFRGRRKIFMVSTPTIAGSSRIEKAYGESDQRRYLVPCPHCGAFQQLVWANVQWPAEQRGLAHYVCEACSAEITERDKGAMLLQGRWEATPSAGDGRTAGFHLSALYSPFETWSEIAIEHGLVHRDPPRLQAWVNLKLGESWEDRGSLMPEPARLMARCERYEGLPEGVAVLTAGVDVQQDRLEVEVCGWGAGEESWSIHYEALRGNPAEPDVWRRLDVVLTARFSGLPVMAACVDTGNWAKSVYEYTAPRYGRRVWAIKGSSIKGAPLWPRRPSKPKPGRPPLFVIGADAAKEIIVSRFSIEEPGPGCCHWPHGRDLDYFAMLTAERAVIRYIRGVAVREWRARGRNEALDCRVYALAALHGLRALGFDLDRESAKPRGTLPSPAKIGPLLVRSPVIMR